jgi:uncharacterized membrane protein YjdF
MSSLPETRVFWGTHNLIIRLELFEWLAAEIFGGELGVAYLGTQGDI